MIGLKTRVPAAAMVLAAAGLAIAGGAFPLATLGLAGALFSTLAIFRYSWFRLLWFLLGAILVFQTSEGLSFPKLVYLALVACGVAVALRRMPETLQQPWARRFRPALLGAAGLAAFILIPGSLHALVTVGNGVQTYARDALTYLLISAGVVLGVDASSDLSPRIARAVTLGMGAIAGYGFAATWITRRGFGPIPAQYANQNLLASMAALIVPLALAVVFALAGRIKIWWLAYAAALILSVLVTGTRTGLVLGVVIVGVMGSNGRQRVSVRRVVIGAAALIAAVAVSLPLVSNQFTSESFGQTRIQQAITAVTKGVTQDPSGIIRARAYRFALDIFGQHPLFGQGLGHSFPNPNPVGGIGNFSLDTPLVYIAKFGLLGTAIFLLCIGLMAASCLSCARGPWLREITVARGASAVCLALLPFGPVTEDKGFALALTMLMVLVGSAARSAMSDEFAKPSPAAATGAAIPAQLTAVTAPVK